MSSPRSRNFPLTPVHDTTGEDVGPLFILYVRDDLYVYWQDWSRLSRMRAREDRLVCSLARRESTRERCAQPADGTKRMIK